MKSKFTTSTPLFRSVLVVLSLVLVIPFLAAAADEDVEPHIYLPIIADGSSETVSSAVVSLPKAAVPMPNYPVLPEDQHWLEHWQDLPYSETPYEGAPIIRPDLTVRGEIAPQQPVNKQEPTKIIKVSGPETAGSKINLPQLGKEVQLPPNVYVEAFVANGLCPFILNDDGTTSAVPCAQTPYYVLGKFGSDAQVRVEPDGQAYVWEQAPEKAQAARTEFKSVLDALEVKLKVDPPFVFPVKP